LKRIIQAVILFGALLLIAGIVALGVLFVISGGQPVDFVQKALIRVALSSRQSDLGRAVSADTTPTRFTVASGDTPRRIAQNLTAQNLITDANLFVDYVRLNDLDTKLQAGTYFLRRSQTLEQIALALTDSRNSQFPFRILEGWRLEEVAAAIDNNPFFGFSSGEFLALVGPGAPLDPQFAGQTGLPGGASLEGFLYPDTYNLPADVTPPMLRDILTRSFLEKVGAQIPTDATTQGFTLYQIVTLASIIQREAIHPDEQPLIASVYRNRLARNMKLDADPTVQYAIGFKEGRWWPRITVADYTGVVSPYNTYLNTGLPPGPIGSPGLTAMRAAVYPASSPYLYFRADCSSDGYHKFARTYAEHLANC
jgi:UPF0755 protein